jgi:ABC-type transport system involved in cytochrome c biogenesis permease subunit
VPELQRDLHLAGAMTFGLTMLIFALAAFWVSRRRALSTTGLLATAAALAMVSGVFAIRWIDQKQFPLQSRYETFLMVLFGLGVGMLLFSARAGLPGKVDSRGGFCNLVCSAGGFIGLVFGFLALREDFEPLYRPPALRSIWMTIHVPCLIISYGFLYVGVAAALVTVAPFLRSALRLGGTADQWDDVLHMAMSIGFPFLTAGLLMGAVWGQEAWATYWGWDIKETWAFITWMVFLVYFHMRMVPGLRGLTSGWVVVVGGASIGLTWLCMHLLPESLSSLHVYN